MRLRDGHGRPLLEPAGIPRRPHDGARARPVDGRLQPRPGRDRRPSGCGRRGHEPREGSGRRLAEATHEHAVARERLLTRHLLLDDRRSERVEDEARARHPPVGEAPPRLGDEVVVRLEARGVVVVAEETRHGVEQPRRARDPRPGPAPRCPRDGTRGGGCRRRRASAPPASPCRRVRSGRSGHPSPGGRHRAGHAARSRGRCATGGSGLRAPQHPRLHSAPSPHGTTRSVDERLTPPPHRPHRPPPTDRQERGTMARETSRDRRERVAEMQAAQKKAERRRLFVVIGACVAVIAIIGAAVAWAIIGEQNKKDEALQNISGDVAAASCDPITNDPASGSSEHVGPGTNQPDVTKITYSTVPPSSGKHFAGAGRRRTSRLHRRGRPADRDAGAQPRARLHDPLVRPLRREGRRRPRSRPCRPRSTP